MSLAFTGKWFERNSSKCRRKKPYWVAILLMYLMPQTREYRNCSNQAHIYIYNKTGAFLICSGFCVITPDSPFRAEPLLSPGAGSFACWQAHSWAPCQEWPTAERSFSIQGYTPFPVNVKYQPSNPQHISTLCLKTSL